MMVVISVAIIAFIVFIVKKFLVHDLEQPRAMLDSRLWDIPFSSVAKCSESSSRVFTCRDFSSRGRTASRSMARFFCFVDWIRTSGRVSLPSQQCSSRFEVIYDSLFLGANRRYSSFLTSYAVALFTLHVVILLNIFSDNFYHGGVAGNDSVRRRH